jgi:hypothetical protein
MSNQIISGFGQGIDQAGLDGLVKALEAGYQLGPNQTGGSALRVQSLESSLKTLSYTHNHIRFWKKIPKSPAFSTIEEYNQVSDYGGTASPFVLEGELPQGSDSSFARKYEKVKYMGTTREVTLQATLVSNAHGDAVAEQNAQGILWLLGMVETYLFSGNAGLAANGDGPQWNGLDALIDPTMVMDMGGNALLPTDFETATNILVENFAYPTDILFSNKVMSDLAKTMYPQHRVGIPAPVNGVIGQSFDTIQLQSGPLTMNACRFITKAASPKAAATSLQAPATPASIVAGAATGTTGDFNKGATSAESAASSYYSYVVTAANRFGESAPTAVQGAAVVLTTANKTAGTYIPLTITNPASLGAQAPEYFRIYRSKASTVNAVPAALTAYSLIAQVPAASILVNGTTVFNDLNFKLPGTSDAYIGELTSQVLTFRQLAPLLKQDYAVVGPSFKWGILLFGTPLLFAPKKWLRIVNIGDLVVNP